MPYRARYRYNSGGEAVEQLYIYPVTTTHGGTYRCSTRNNVGQHQRNLTLIVVGRYDDTEYSGLACCMYMHAHNATQHSMC